jgi:toxin ParE1/3/4
MKLRFTPRAIADIEEIADYVRVRNPGAAQRVRAAIYESLQTLILFPHIGRQQKAEGVRKLLTRRFVYFIYYTVDEAAEEIVILNVKHPARRREHEDAWARALKGLHQTSLVGRAYALAERRSACGGWPRLRRKARRMRPGSPKPAASAMRSSGA